MHIVLDTNILQEDFLLRSRRFEMLFDYAKRTASSIVIPQIVMEELIANYSRKLQERALAWRRAVEQVNGVLISPLKDPPTLDVENLSIAYRAHVLTKLMTSESQLLGLKPEYLSEVVMRAIHRRAPCNSSGEEIRDALIWMSIRDLATISKTTVVLLSRNTSQFSIDKATLHPDLVAEAQKAGADVKFYPSIEEFIKEHATPIEFITTDWISSKISVDDLYDRIRKQVERLARKRLAKLCKDDEEPAGDVDIIGGTAEVDDFFVYTMADGSIRIESNWSGLAEIEFEVNRIESDVSYSYDPFTNSLEPEWDRYRIRGTRVNELYFVVSVEITVENKEVVDWSADVSLG